MRYQLSKTDALPLDADRILCNDVIAAGEDNPHKVGLWVITSRYGPVAAVWAAHEEDALDEAADADLLKVFAMSAEEESTRDYVPLGNESDPYDLDDAHIRRIAWKDIPEETQEDFLLARDEGLDTLADIEDREDDDEDDDSDDSDDDDDRQDEDRRL